MQHLNNDHSYSDLDKVNDMTRKTYLKEFSCMKNVLMHVDNRKLMVLYGDITTKILGKHLHIEYANMYKSHLETCG